MEEKIRCEAHLETMVVDTVIKETWETMAADLQEVTVATMKDQKKWEVDHLLVATTDNMLD